jgi:hypothetical protein
MNHSGGRRQDPTDLSNRLASTELQPDAMDPSDDETAAMRTNTLIFRRTLGLDGLTPPNDVRSRSCPNCRLDGVTLLRSTRKSFEELATELRIPVGKSGYQVGIDFLWPAPGA